MNGAKNDGLKNDEPRANVRFEDEDWKKIKMVSEMEGKNPAQLIRHATLMYIKIYASMQFLKGVKLNPEFDSDYTAAREKLIDAIEKTL